jgi:hypothetical protein
MSRPRKNNNPLPLRTGRYCLTFLCQKHDLFCYTLKASICDNFGITIPKCFQHYWTSQNVLKISVWAKNVLNISKWAKMCSTLLNKPKCAQNQCMSQNVLIIIVWAKMCSHYWMILNEVACYLSDDSKNGSEILTFLDFLLIRNLS